MGNSVFRRFTTTMEAAGAAGLQGGLGRLSPAAASALGARLFRAIGPRLGASRVARRNLARLFPEDRVEALLPEVWGNLGRTFFEYPHLDHLYDGGHIEFCGLDELDKVLTAGRGGIFFSGHVANWECLSFLPHAAGFDASLMYRAPNNSRVAEILQRCRPNRRVGFIPKSTAGTRQAFSLLAAKGHVGMLIDHRYNQGIEVDFLGGRAMVAPTAALMAQRHGCPLIPVRVERLESLRYRVTVQPAFAPDPALPRAEAAHRLMQRALTIIEDWIRDRPDQWFWMQRLWR